jgi:hypothetical protein
MLGSKVNSVASVATLLTSFYCSDNTRADDPPAPVPIVRSIDTDVQVDITQRIKKTLGDDYNDHRAEDFQDLLTAGLSFDSIASISPDRLGSFKRALSYVKPNELERIAAIAPRFGEENAWRGADTWVENLRELSDESVEKVLELREMRREFTERDQDPMSANNIAMWSRLIEGGAPLAVLAPMDSSDGRTIDKAFTEGRFPKELFALINSNPRYQYSEKAAEADPDFDKGVTAARDNLIAELKKREHVERSSTDYTEGVEQFEAIKDPHQIFLIKQYLEYFSKPITVIALNALFPVIPESEKEEEGGIIVATDGGIRFIHIPQYVKEGDKRGDERNAFKTPEICDYIDHLGVLHTHPGGPAFAGPSGYSKPTFGPGRYYPHGDTYSLAAANEDNPRIVEVVVTELSTGRINIDLFLRDVEVGKDGKVSNTDPVRIIDLGVFELPEAEMTIKLALAEKLQEQLIGSEQETPHTILELKQEIEETVSRSSEKFEFRAYAQQSIENIDSWSESVVNRSVRGTKLLQAFDTLVGLLDEETLSKATIPEFLDLLSMGVAPEQLKDVHRYHIYGLAKGFRTGRYPERFLDDLGKSHIEYMQSAVFSDPDVQKGSRWAKEYVREQLQQREHLFKLDTDYKEGLSTLDNTNDKYMLLLIKRYVDFFNKPENWDGLTDLFRDAHADYPEDSVFRNLDLPTPERGGMMLVEDGEIVFQEIKANRSSSFDVQRASNSFTPPHIQYYGTALGGVHTHPLDLHQDPRSTGDLRDVSGPSGKANPDNTEDAYANDTGSLRYFNRGYPFALEVVITELGKARFNVDIYYRDITEKDGKAVNDRNVSVLDLGVFEPTKEKLESGQ